MAEFDVQRAPLGIPGNPLDGVPGLAADAPTRKRKEGGVVAPLQVPPRMDQSGITDAGGVPGAVQLPQWPEQLLAPSPVSATDPAYSMHPMTAALGEALSKVPASDFGSASPWAQLLQKRPSKNAFLDTKSLHAGLGMDLPYHSQGVSTIT